MTKNIFWNFTCTLKDGKREEFDALASEMITQVNENEPGTLVYEWWLNEDGKTVHCCERFKDSAAALTHLGTFGNFADRFLACVDPTGFTVYGDASSEVRDAVKDLGATFHSSQVGPGFVR